MKNSKSRGAKTGQSKSKGTHKPAAKTGIKANAKTPIKKLNNIKMAPKAAKKALTKTPAKPAVKAKGKAIASAKPEPKELAKKSQLVKAISAKNASGKEDKTPKKETVDSKASKSKSKTEISAGKILGGKTTSAGTTVAAVLAKTPSSAIDKRAAKAQAAIERALANAEKMCRENGCENQATTKGFCRLDYIKNWKKIKRKEMILKEGKLNQYIEELVGKYPDKYIDVIRQDLSSEVNFTKVIHDLELDESIDDLDYDGDSIDALIGGIRKEEGGGFDDDEF